MRAAVFRGAFDIQVEQVPDATILEPTDAVVQITHACICGIYTYAGNEACKLVCLQKSTEIKCCVQGRCKQRRDLGSKLVHHAGRGENSILVLLCLDEAQNVLKTS